MAKSKAAGGPLAVTIDRAELLRALTATTRAVESRNAYPILSNVLLIAEPAALTIRATDLDIEIAASAPADVGSTGSTTVPAKTLLDIVRKFPDGAEVRLSLEGDALVVKAGRSRFQLPTLSADNFPDIQTGTFGEPFTTDLAELAGQVAFAISDDSARYYLNGVYLHTVNGRLRAVATDGHRLARADGDAVAPTLAGVIVPKKTVALLPPGPVQVEVSDTKIRVTAGAVTLVSKLIEGVFPDYDRVTPKNNDKLATVDRASLLAAVDRVSIVASERGGKAVKVSASPGLLTLDVANAEGGSASEDVAADSEHEFVIGYNAGYLADILRAIGGGTARFAWNDPASPTVVTGDNDNLLMVCMPMRVA
jgi:DNA polymerase-3 subunit beta